MAYDEGLATRVRDVVGDEPGVSEKRMFGGLAFMVHGNMAVSASSRGGLLLRVDPDHGGSLVDPPDVEPFGWGGGRIPGGLHAGPAAVAADDDLRRWVAIGLDYARSLPAK